MADMIKVLIVDDIAETRDHLTKLLGFESDIEVVGAADSGREALELAGRLRPDVVLMDINMPDMDGIAATEQLAAEVPTAAVVMMSVQGEADYLRRSMLAGAREFLVKPFSSDELTASIRQVYTRERDKQGRITITDTAAAAAAGAAGARDREPGQLVAVFSPKGGVGRTTIAVNLAVAAAADLGIKTVARRRLVPVRRRRRAPQPEPEEQVDRRPRARARGGGEPESIDTFVINHSSGVRVLLAPPSPEMAEMITPAGVRKILEALRATTRPGRRRLHGVLQRHDPGDPRRGRHDPDGAHARDHEHQEHAAVPRGRRPARLRGVEGASWSSTAPTRRSASASRTSSTRSAGRWTHTIVSDGRSVVYALNRGVPFVLSNREAQVSQDILRLATAITGGERKATVPDDAEQGCPEEVVVRMAVSSAAPRGLKGCKAMSLLKRIESARPGSSGPGRHRRTCRLRPDRAVRLARRRRPRRPGSCPRARSGSRSGTSSSGSRTGSSRTWTRSSTCRTRSRSGARSRRSSARSSTRKASP